MTDTDRQQIERLLDGSLPWEELRNDVLPDPKDRNRFETTREILQERVEWDDPVLLPLTDHLYAVGTDEGRVVRCECGEDLCPLGENWKQHANIRVRESEAEQREVYPQYMTAHPDWSFQLREFFCPSCFAQLDVDAVPACYPILQNFEPAIDTFYEEWLGRKAPDRR